ncbi:MAG: protein kinase [Myxococcales bacterium]|nr:protein kinase [Myxococcales bacterium]
MGIVSSAGGSKHQAGRQPRVIPFGKYLLLQRLAVGGMAEVFLAKSFGVEGFEKIIAIKRILPTMAEDEDFIDMFIDEAKIAGHLSHANIVPIYELGKIGESHYIAMEFVWGKDLLQVMNRFRKMRRRMPAAMVAYIGTKMCEALEYAHNKRDRSGQPLRLIHRDISPQNVLISYEGAVKLIDFGIAKATARTTKTQAGVLKGKFGYMSPEQVRGNALDARSDIFAVGTCLYEMITSDRLFMGESDFSTLEKVRNAAVPPPSSLVEGLTDDFDRVIMKALAKDPDERFSTAGEMQEALMEYLVTQRPPFTTSRLGEWMRSAFASEADEEKDRIESFARIGRPPPLGAGLAPADGPATQRPPSRVEAPITAPIPRANPPAATADLTASLDDFDFDDDDFEAEATAITASPFEAMQEAADDDFKEEPTHIFFSADDLELVEEESSPALPASSPLAASAAQAPPRGLAAPPSGLGAPRPPGLPPPPAPSLAPAAGVAGPAPEMSRSRLLSLIAAAAVLLLGLGIAGGYAISGGPEPVAAAATLEISTSPAMPASVSLDGEPQGSAPLRITGVPTGRRLIEIAAEGYQPVARVVELVENQVMSLEIAMQPGAGSPPALAQAPAGEAAAGGAPEVAEAPRAPQPPAAEAAAEAPAAPVAPVEPPSPSSPMRASAPVASPMRASAPAVSPMAESTMTESAMTTRRGRGSVLVHTTPWARVFLDGRDTGRNTPTTLRMRAGAHRLGLRTNDGRMHNFELTVEAGESTRFVRRLQ